MAFIVIPKRKMLRLQEDTVHPEPISPPSSVVIPPSTLSNLLINTNKNWAGYSIEGLGAPSDYYGAVRKYDILSAIEFIIDGGGAIITTGIKGDVRLPFAGKIISVALSASKESGSIVVDIWKDTTVGYPPTVANTITASAKPTISAARNSLNATLVGWTKTFAYGDYLMFKVDSVTTLTLVTLTLVVRRS